MAGSRSKAQAQVDSPRVVQSELVQLWTRDGQTLWVAPDDVPAWQASGATTRPFDPEADLEAFDDLAAALGAALQTWIHDVQLAGGRDPEDVTGCHRAVIRDASALLEVIDRIDRGLAFRYGTLDAKAVTMQDPETGEHVRVDPSQVQHYAIYRNHALIQGQPAAQQADVMRTAASAELATAAQAITDAEEALAALPDHLREERMAELDSWRAYHAELGGES